MNRPETISTIKRRYGARIGKMTVEEARAYLFAHSVYTGGRPDGRIVPNGRLGDPGLKFLTGGYSSQTLDGMVLRKLGIRAGYVRSPS